LGSYQCCSQRCRRWPPPTPCSPANQQAGPPSRPRLPSPHLALHLPRNPAQTQPLILAYTPSFERQHMRPLPPPPPRPPTKAIGLRVTTTRDTGRVHHSAQPLPWYACKTQPRSCAPAWRSSAAPRRGRDSPRLAGGSWSAARTGAWLEGACSGRPCCARTARYAPSNTQAVDTICAKARVVHLRQRRRELQRGDAAHPADGRCSAVQRALADRDSRLADDGSGGAEQRRGGLQAAQHNLVAHHTQRSPQRTQLVLLYVTRTIARSPADSADRDASTIAIVRPDRPSSTNRPTASTAGSTFCDLGIDVRHLADRVNLLDAQPEGDAAVRPGRDPEVPRLAGDVGESLDQRGEGDLRLRCEHGRCAL
jgi:hypothetical protein